MSYYTECRFAKPEPRVIAKRRAEKFDAKQERACQQCNEPLPAGARGRQFCSVACRNRWIAEQNRKYPWRPCPICGKRFQGTGKTCSAACGYRFRKVGARREKECPICRCMFWPVRRNGLWSKYCSKACYNAKLSERMAMVRVACEQCGREFRRTKGAVKRVERTFCNRVCAQKFLSGENHPNWRGGHDPNRGPAWLRLAAEIRKRDEYKCRRCGRTQAENGQKLDVDHIVPWRLFPGRPDLANDPKNLVSLCRKCHRHKTAKLERAYLNGDCLGMYAYEESISLPPLFEHYQGTGR